MGEIKTVYDAAKCWRAKKEKLKSASWQQCQLPLKCESNPMVDSILK